MRYERLARTALIVSIAGSVIFAGAYILRYPTGALGFGAALAFIGLCVAFAVMGNKLTAPEEAVDERETFERAHVRPLARPALLHLLAGAIGVLGLASIFPLRSLGSAPGNTLFKTKWARGVRVVRDDGRTISRDDLNVDGVLTVFPEGSVGDPESQTVLLRVRPGELPQSPDGYLAFSKVCTHAGCPVAMYRAQQRQLLCPCHQSLFDVLDGGKVLSGPADRPLPQLPIAFDDAGQLRAQAGFSDAVGPGFWEHA